MGLEALGRRGLLGGALALLLAAQAGTALAADLKVGANIGNVPWEFQDASGKFVGFEIDLVNEVAKRLGKTVEIGTSRSRACSPPCSRAGSTWRCRRSRSPRSGWTRSRFAQPYYDSDQSLTVTAASGITGLDGMKGKIVAVDTGSTGDIWATENQAKYGFADIRRFEGLAPAMLDLQAGRIDGYISDIPALLYYTKDKPQFKVVERIPTGEKYSIMFAKDAPLAGRGQRRSSTTLKKEGFIAGLHETWFGAKADDGHDDGAGRGHAQGVLSLARAGSASGAGPPSIAIVIDTFFNVRVLAETLPLLLSGLWVTVLLGLTSIVLGIAGGLALALLRIYAPSRCAGCWPRPTSTCSAPSRCWCC